jgi:hypothetical protein
MFVSKPKTCPLSPPMPSMLKPEDSTESTRGSDSIELDSVVSAAFATKYNHANANANTNTSNSTASTTSTSSYSEQRVRFGTLEIHEHVVALGGACVPRNGAPLTLSWEPQAEYLVSVDDYEELKPPARKGEQLLRSKNQRTDL